jgi:hypothetical protein
MWIFSILSHDVCIHIEQKVDNFDGWLELFHSTITY